MRRVVVVVAFLATFVPLVSAEGASYTFTTIDVPGAKFTSAFGINDAGQIVGYYFDGTANHGFIYSGGAYTTLTVPQATTSTSAYGINNAGQVVGGYWDGSNNRAFLYSGGSYTTLPVQADIAYAFGINNAGQIVGWAGGSSSNGFLYSGGVFTTLTVPQATTSTSAHGINDAGQIVGGYYDGSNNRAFLFSGGSYTTLNIPSSIAYAYSINDVGGIVGWNSDTLTFSTGFLLDSGILTQLPARTSANGINDAGQIVGYYWGDDGVNHGFLASPVPDVPLPPTLFLFGSGLGCLCFLRKRRRFLVEQA